MRALFRKLLVKQAVLLAHPSCFEHNIPWRQILQKLEWQVLVAG